MVSAVARARHRFADDLSLDSRTTANIIRGRAMEANRVTMARLRCAVLD